MLLWQSAAASESAETVHAPSTAVRIDPECLAIEQAFAHNAISELAALTPKTDRWKALQSFRLASAFIPAGENKRALQAIKSGLAVVRSALKQNPQDVEMLLLGTMLDGEFLLINRWRFLHNGLRGLRRIARAEALDPDNPRAALIRGSAKVVLPGIFGGDAEEAVTLLESAVSDTELCAGGEWAQIDILNWLGRAHSKLEENEAARRYYQRALLRSPGNYWVELAMQGAGYEWQPDDS